MLWFAGVNNKLETVKWLYSEGAALPSSFFQTVGAGDALVNTFWPARIVSFAVAVSGKWGEWQCNKFAPAAYHKNSKRSLCTLFVWAHKNGCPCTCPRAVAARST
jgi:hypothetical protein